MWRGLLQRALRARLLWLGTAVAGSICSGSAGLGTGRAGFPALMTRARLGAVRPGQARIRRRARIPHRANVPGRAGPTRGAAVRGRGGALRWASASGRPASTGDCARPLIRTSGRATAGRHAGTCAVAPRPAGIRAIAPEPADPRTIDSRPAGAGALAGT